MTRLRYTLTTIALPIVILGALSSDARATPLSESIINGSSFVVDEGTTSSAATLGGNSASSFVNPLTGTMGAAVRSDGTAFSVSATSRLGDDWFCSGSCDALSSGAVTLSAAVSFDAIVSGSLAAGVGEFSLVAKFDVGIDQFLLDASADSSPLSADASLDGLPIDLSITTDASGNVHLSAGFVRTIVCPCEADGSPIFSDRQEIQLEMEGSGFVDASHTFTAALTPLDAGLVFTSADGRTIGSAPAGAPVPEPASMLLVGTGLAAVARRYRRGGTGGA